MKHRDLFWCGTALFVLSMFISLQCVQDSVYSAMAGGLCALVAVILFGCGLQADARQRAADESKHIDDEQKQHKAHAEGIELIQSMLVAIKDEVHCANEIAQNETHTQREFQSALLGHLDEWFDGQQKSYSTTMQQLKASISDITEEIQSLRKSTITEGQSYSAKICRLLLEQHDSLLKALDTQGKVSENYYKFMISKPWNEIHDICETLKSTADTLETLLSSVDSLNEDAERNLNSALEKLEKDSTLLQEKLNSVCDTLESQGKENRDVMDRLMQSYTNVTAQDIELLTSLARDEKA